MIVGHCKSSSCNICKALSAILDRALHDRPLCVPPAALICSTRRVTASMNPCTQPMIWSGGLSGGAR
jgi:hypothetical protein